MLIQDPIYGKCEVSDQVLIDLIESKSMQRLKGVAQYGWHNENYPYPGFSRFEHSVGVMLLLKKLGADLKTQIAGLLHDISHTAFSHCVDYALGHEENEDFHDTIVDEYFENSDTKNIIKNYNYDQKEIVDVDSFSIIKSNIPNASADNIDYALREFEIWANPGLSQDILNNLAVIDNEIVFKRFDLAKVFADTFLRLQTEHWGGLDASSRHLKMAKVLKMALDDQIIVKDDLFVDDQFVMNKLYKSNRKDLIDILENAHLKEVNQLLGKKIIKKFRYVDPKVLLDEDVKALSTIDKKFVENLNKHKENNLSGLQV
ncbi:HD domain-containing protein [Patescibacteria group bacterium]|nr:HD domain-containing protein [Patescibacteria group bacterium]